MNKLCNGRAWLSRGTLALLWLWVSLLPAGIAQQRTDEDPLPDERSQGAQRDDADLDRELDTPRRSRSMGEIVNVFNSSELRPNERASSAVTVWGNARIQGELTGECVTVFGNTDVTGPIDGECVTVFGDLYLNNTVRGELVVVMGNARFGPQAEVHGECVVIGGKITADPESTFYRQRREFAGFLPPLGAWFKYGLLLGRPLVPSLGWVWVIFALHFFVYFLVVLLLPKPVEACERALRDQPLASFGVGLLGFFLFWPALTIVAATGVGLLVIPFLLIAALGAVILGKAATFQWIGGNALRSATASTPGMPLASFLLGTAVVALLYMVPLLGFVTWGVLLPLAFGATLMALIEIVRESRARRPQAALVSVPRASLATPGSPDLPPASNPPADPAPPLPGASFAVPPTVLPVEASPLGVVPAEMTALPRAGFWIRVAAALLDLVLLGWFMRLVDGYFPLLWIAYHIGMWTWKGTTIGGIVCGLKVVREDGRSLDFTVALVRSLAAVFSFVALGIGFFWAGWSPERQSWHDKIAGTVIVKVPKGMALV